MTSPQKFIINVSDSFVHPLRKMAKAVGQVGHGERRLYVGNDKDTCDLLATKPWLFDFSQFSEPRDPIQVVLCQQNGSEDVRRFYLGVKGTEKSNIQAFDDVRKSVIPQGTCFLVEEDGDVFRAQVTNAESVERKPGSPGYSKVALRWLTYEAARQNITIRHAENGGEFSIRTKKGYKWPVDGFCEATKTVYEFHGDYFHGNPKRFAPTDLYHGVPYAKKWEKDELKRRTLEEMGFTVVIMWESDWIQTEKAMKLANAGKAME